jgi:hypothetical protein
MRVSHFAHSCHQDPASDSPTNVRVSTFLAKGMRRRKEARYLAVPAHRPAVSRAVRVSTLTNHIKYDRSIPAEGGVAGHHQITLAASPATFPSSPHRRDANGVHGSRFFESRLGHWSALRAGAGGIGGFGRQMPRLAFRGRARAFA